MKKYLLIYVLSALFMHNTRFLNAQNPEGVNYYDRSKYDVVDSADYQILYQLEFVDNLDKPTKQSNQLALLIGSKYSKFFNAQYLFYVKPKNIPANGAEYFDGKGLAATEVYKNKKSKETIVTVKLSFIYNYVFRYKEENIVQKWEFGNKEKTILGYNCQMATTSFLGRNYTAWFAPDIPVSDGPWKFSGLPGLILEVADSQNQYVFKCTGIKKLSQRLPIFEYKANYKDTTRNKVNKSIMKVNKNPTQFILDMNLNCTFVENGKETKNPTIPPDRRYNFIELE